MELIIYTPTEDQYLKAIEFNADEIKTDLAVQLKKYEGIVYSEDSIKSAKTDRATLNKFKEAIEDKRKEIKKKCLAPYDAFEIKIKEIVAMVDKPIESIDAQVKKFEEETKTKKKERIKSFYDANIGDLKELLPLPRLFNEKWLNTGTKLKDIEAEIVEVRDRVTKDLEVIKTLKTDFELQVKDFYLRTLDLSGALAEKSQLEEQKEKLAHFEAAKTEQAKPVEVATAQVDAEKVTIKFSVTGTQAQINALKEFLSSNKIQYGRI